MRFLPRRAAWGWLALLVGLIALPLPATLRAATFSISFEQDTVTVGESVTMTMTFDGGAPETIPLPPNVPGLTIQDAHNDMSSVSIINGQMSQKIMHTFVVTPTQPGRFVIPSLTAKIQEQVCVSQPVTLTVTKPGAPPSNVDAANPDMAFMRLEVPKKSVYVGEVIRGELQLYLREGIVRIADVQMTPPQAEGFTVGKTVEMQHRQTRVGNYNYTIIPMAATYTAAKVGKLTLGSTECSMTLLTGPFDFFGQPRGRKHVSIASPPVTIDSLPLPTENVPPGFSGAVGNYSMNLSVTPTNVAVGDPITVKVDIIGTGALDSLTLPPQMGWHQFKLYPPTSNFTPGDQLGITGTNSFALTAVAENTDVKELPPFIFTYFDPDRKTYQTLSHPAVPLIVRPSAASLPPPTFASANASDNPPPMQDVSPIKTRIGELATLSPPLVRQPWFLALQGLPALAWVTLLVRRRQIERLANNPRLRRQREVEQTIRIGLKKLHESANDSETFFATVFHLLQERLGERLDLPASAITESVLDEKLRPLGVPESLLALLRELFQACNQARYARQTNAEMVSLIPRVESALNDLKNVKA